MFALMQSSHVETLHFIVDPETGLKALIAIHNSQNGPALGGCRYLDYSDEQSAIQDAIRLAHIMSYKAVLAGLPYGGGKAVIMRPAHVPNRAALFESFGRFIETLDGRYITAVDSGTSSADMDCIAQHTQHVTSTTEAGDPSLHAAMGVFAGIRATAVARLGSDNLEGLRVAVQGLGHVGFALAEQLHAAGADLLVSDLDSGKVQLAMEQFGAHPIACDALLSTPCDIFAPCGLGGILTSKSVAQLRCAAVAGAANNQLTDLQVGDQLEGRGILYAPDYVINSGGLIYVALQHQGETPNTITAHLSRIGTRLTEVFAHAQAEKRSPARVANDLAERLLNKGY
ncbi:MULTISPECIES: Glu/Leu/Phe/Val dehydrogenase dimerization domain-containing protein [unclassified Pseudomonas]|uniref:Glu/Leu/Phe/Val dehydrogenase family protein n=1 Tax=unclassified Pseudomonas TaxID=196821 RepID=UPI002AC97E99|nr:MULTISPECIES: Glu/Leu/Phe/Val dehydrogenase dimerization domain-containing protein [unclassified Pseudomonas]MEB0042746.1 Glu/Leu/Phe/Val dehydrogenase dimerization domain-containing protein [Pseudomonas sp. MH10]MEB0079894.1 Glu/Leu/Phe/Val dehydrogenase dimerization domain-containing protein [Pseudomonas sp. MH10out]MEB0094116.1 Glu/Leu/Phe/Val dehydrogenase dimerization domain-containing protein [Pseudomonas sp. CCI4.2]MEB0103516.1 Glu/Leu/Phe/Val dehydrogenase dimerization domain-contain